MKKPLATLTALAALGTLTTAASAQTNVQIYGIVDAGFARTDNGAATINALDSGIQSGSRIGFKGSEDLGGGLSAIFTLENGFNADTGTLGQGGRLFGRQSFVGLASNAFGQIKFGRQNNPIRPIVETVDPFGIGLAGNASFLFNVYGDRADNTINWTSPTWGGVSGQLAYSFGEVPGANATGRQIGANLAYAAGPVWVALAYHNQNLTSGTPVVDAGSAKTTLLAGTYDFTVAKAHLAYAWNKADNAAGAQTRDTRDLLLGASVPVGQAGAFLASYGRKYDKRVSNGDTRLWALGYTYAVSKRTNFYTSYGRLSNDGGATLGYTGSTSVGTVAAGNNTSTFNVGVRHKF
ncbi:porin [Oxalobacteraceae bacterium OM1]|nr:porin [Oxalobacteraceae bacterium OM1]